MKGTIPVIVELFSRPAEKEIPAATYVSRTCAECGKACSYEVSKGRYVVTEGERVHGRYPTLRMALYRRARIAASRQPPSMVKVRSQLDKVRAQLCRMGISTEAATERVLGSLAADRGRREQVG